MLRQFTITGKIDHHFDGEEEHPHYEVWSNVPGSTETLDDILEAIGDHRMVKVTVEVNV